MSSIDNRIVKMQFDGAQFLKGAKETISLLAQLKTALNMEGAAKSLDSISMSAAKATLQPLEESVERTQGKFSILAQAAAVALGNIATRAIETGAQMLSAFTTQPITQGFEEYELKMNSIQTMLMATGEPLSRVNQKLDELNTYADKTIYSFADMTQNIGKFTNAGVSLDESVAAIQGVANVAAISGANANEASHAMYNFAQALSSGAVKLIDWKSIENANMATVEFKNELIKTAVEVGTLVESEGKYISTTTDLNGHVSEAFDSVSMFNDSLSAQWLTTDVLTKTLGRYADETTEIGKKAFKAASQVKTFSQLIDTVKESIGSGWAQTWEIVFGDFNESLDLWTKVSKVIDEFVGKQSEARNSMLQEWKDLGGREDVIKGLSNALSFFASILKTIGNAWQEVFPPTTGQQLANITSRFQEVTSRMKLSDAAAQNLHDTFKGLFSVLEVVGSVFTGFISSLLPMGSGINSVSEAILSFTGTIGRFASSLSESIMESGFFQETFNSLSEIIQNGAEKMGDALKTAISWLKDFGASVSETGFFRSIIDEMNEFKQHMADSDSVFSGLSENLKKIFDPKRIAKVAGGFAEAIGAVFYAVSDFIVKVLDSGGLSSLIHAGMLTRFLDDIKEFTGGVTNPLEAFAELTDKVANGAADVLDTMKSALESFQGSVRANTLLKIAGAIAVLATAVIVLGTIDPSKIVQALTSTGILLAELMGSLLLFEKLSSGKGMENLEKAGTGLVALAASVLILTGAMKVFAGMDMNEIARGLISIAILCATLVTATNKMDRSSKKLISSSLGLVIFAEAIKELGVVVAGLGSLDVETLAKGLISVGSMIAGLAAFINLTDLKKIGVFKGAALIEMAYSIKMLADVVKDLGNIDSEGLLNGLASVGIILSELAIFTTVTGNSKHIISTAIAMGIMSLAMAELAQVVGTFSNLSWEEIARGLTGIAGALLVMGVATAAMPKGLGLLAVEVGIMGVALSALSVAMAEFGDMKWDEIGRALVAMAGSLTVLAIAVKFMQTALPGAAALLVVSAAMMIFAPAMKILGELKLKEVGIALLALAGALTIIGIAGIALTPAIPTILAFAAALGALALVIGVITVAVVALMASDAFNSLSQGFAGVGHAIESLGNQITAASIVETIKGILESIITLIPSLATALLDALMVFAQGIISAAPVFGEAIKTVLTTIIDVITTCIPAVVEAAAQLILAICNALITYGPQLISTMVMLIVMLVNAIAAYAPVLIDAGIKLSVGLINGIANGIRDNQEAIFSAVKNLISVLIELILSVLQEVASLIPVVGDKMSEGLEKAKTKVRETLAPESMAEIGKEAVDGLNDGIVQSTDQAVQSGEDLGSQTKDSILSGIGDIFSDGSDVGSGFANGLSSMVGMASTSGTDVATAGLMGLLSNASQYGETGSIDGMDFANMLNSMSGEANGAGTEVTSSALEGLLSNASEYGLTGDQNGSDYVNELESYASEAANAGNTLGSNAASGVQGHSAEFQNAGSDAGSGFVNGILGWASSAASAAANMVSSAIASARKAMDSNSPSKEFMRMGYDADKGLAIGFEEMSDYVSQSSADVAKEALKTAAEAMSKVTDEIDENPDFSPKISPVVDLTNVSESAGQISSMLDTSTSLRMAADLDSRNTRIDNMDEIVSQLSESINNQDSKFTDGINEIKEQLSAMVANLTGLKVVMDNGTLVGELVGPMDVALGQRTIFVERGM